MTENTNNEPLPLSIRTGDDGDIIIEWDEKDPRAIALGCNEWTSEEWSKKLDEGLQRLEETYRDQNDD